jgi:hypothetical protein
VEDYRTRGIIIKEITFNSDGLPIEEKYEKSDQ